MNAQMAVLAVGLALLGLLLYPNSKVESPTDPANWVETMRPIPNEELHFPIVYRADPKVHTYDLGYVYNIDKAELIFENPSENGPKQFDILTNKSREGIYERGYSFRASSREYTYSSLKFASKEARWVQVAINDWFNVPPKLTSFKVGTRYKSPGPSTNISVNYNPQDAYKLIDGIRSESSKWVAAERQVSYKAPSKDIIAIFDLGGVKRIYATRISGDDPPNTLRRYQLSVSNDGRGFVQVYQSNLFEAQKVEDLQKFSPTPSGRFLKLTIKEGDWYGDYPQIREFEIFTNNYRLSDASLPIDQYNAVQVYYEDCGKDNSQAPHLTQGFPFDRGKDSDERFRYVFKDDEVNPKTALSHRSFAYHYDSVIFSFDKLDPQMLYWVEITYLQEKDGARSQNLMVDEFLLHGDEIEIAIDEAKKYSFQIPPETYADSKIRLSFNRLSGPNAAVSEVSILMARPSDEVQIADGKTRQVSSSAASGFTSIGRPTSLTGRATQVAIPIKIDGDISEWPLFYPLLPQGYPESPLTPCQTYVQWDENNLYLALTLRQDILKQSESEKGDKTHYLHAFVDANLNRSPGMYTPEDHHFRFGPLSLSTIKSRNRITKAAQIHHHRDAIPNSIYDYNEIEFFSKNDNDTYILEAKIPKDKVLKGFKPDLESKFGFNYVISEGANQKFYWSAPNTDAPPSLWSQVELVGKLSGEVVVLDKTLKSRLSHFNAGDDLILCVWDPDRNLDLEKAESIQATIEGNLNHDRKIVNLYETKLSLLTDPESEIKTSNNSDLFAAKIKTVYAKSKSNSPDTISVQGYETLTLSYVDPYSADRSVNQTITYTLTTNVGHSGVVVIHNEKGGKIETFNSGDPLYITVKDEDLSSTSKPEAVVSIYNYQKDTETVLLRYSEEADAYAGSIKTEYSQNPKPEDGILQVEGAQTLSVVYVDEIQDDGQTKVSVLANASVNVGDTSLLLFRPQVKRRPNEELQGFKVFNAGDQLEVYVKDLDLNKDNSKVEWAEVEISGDALNDRIVISLNETKPNSGEFVGSISTSYAVAADLDDKVLQTTGSEKIKLTYQDQLQGSGETNVNATDTIATNIGQSGEIRIVKSNYITDLELFNAKDTLYFIVRDADLDLYPELRESVEVEVKSEMTADVESATLVETGPASKTFTGSLPTGYETLAKPSDGILQVQGREKVYVSYTDELQGDGRTMVIVGDYCTVNSGYSGQLIAYKSDNPKLPITTFRAGDTLLITLKDEDLDISSAAAQFFEATSSEDVIRDEVQIILREVSGSEGIFRGELKTEYGEKPVLNDNILQVQGLSSVTLTYVDALQDTGATQIPVVLKLNVEVGNVASLEAYNFFSRDPINHFSAGDTILVNLQDKDLDLDPKSQDFGTVIVKGETLGDELLVVLGETSPDSGIFQARLRTEYSPRPDVTDDMIQVTEKEVISLTYIDRISATGEPDRPISKRLVVTGSSPGKLLIVDEQRREVGSFSPGRTIYFFLEDIVVSTFDPNAEVKILVNGNKTNDLEELKLERSPNEPGVYVGSISTRYGTTPISDGMLEVQGGEEVAAIYHPKTPGSFNQPIIDACYVNRGNRGILSIIRPDGGKLANFNPGETILFRLEDRDLNINPFEVDYAEIRVRRGNEEGYKLVRLEETSVDSGVFIGRLKTVYGRSSETSSALELIGGELVGAIYLDALTDSGETNLEIQDATRANMIGWADYTLEPVVIDGIIDKWPLENVMRTEDGNGLLWLQWDKDNLYVLAEVYDSKVSVPDPTRWYKSADALELHIDISPGIDERPTYMRNQPKPTNYVFWFSPQGAGSDGGKVYVGQAQPNLLYNYSPPIQATARIVHGAYYILEIRIPFNPALGGFDPIKSAKIDRIGFNYLIYRSDAPSIEWSKEHRVDQANAIPSQLSQLGTVFLRKPGMRR